MMGNPRMVDIQAAFMLPEHVKAARRDRRLVLSAVWAVVAISLISAAFITYKVESINGKENQSTKGGASGQKPRAVCV